MCILMSTILVAFHLIPRRSSRLSPAAPKKGRCSPCRSRSAVLYVLRDFIKENPSCGADAMPLWHISYGRRMSRRGRPYRTYVTDMIYV